MVRACCRLWQALKFVVYCQLYVYSLGRENVEMTVRKFGIAGFHSRVRAAEKQLLRVSIGKYM